MKRLLIFLGLWACSWSQLSFGDEVVAGFRGMPWGASIEAVKDKEKAKLIQEKTDGRLHILLYSDTLVGLQSAVGYIFADGKLTSGKVTSLDSHVNNDAYFDDYDKWQEALTSKYGKGKAQELVSSTFKNKPGLALVTGEAKKLEQWEHGDTSIGILLHGDNYKAKLEIGYWSKSLESLERAARKSKDDGKL